MIHSRGFTMPRTLAEVVDPGRCALLVYDMQIGVCRQIADRQVVIERVSRCLEAARGAGMRVAWARHLSLPKPWMGLVQTRMAMAWQRTDDPDAVEPWFLPDNPATGIVPELTPRADEFVFDKLSMSAFEGTMLPFALRDLGLASIAMVGVALEIGIEPSARHAADLGFVPVVVEDACGFGSAEAAARSVAALRFAGDAVLTDTAAFGEALARPAVA